MGLKIHIVIYFKRSWKLLQDLLSCQTIVQIAQKIQNFLSKIILLKENLLSYNVINRKEMNLKIKGVVSMLLSEVRVLLGNAKYQITGAAAKEAINTMTEKIEASVLNGEEVELTIVTHKNTGIVYLLCNAQAVNEKKFVCISLYGGDPKLYSESTIKRMFRKTVETLVTEEDTDAEADTASDDTVPAVVTVDTDDEDAAADQADTASEDPAVPEVTDTPSVPAAADPEVPEKPAVPAVNNKLSREDYAFLKNKTNAMSAEIVKYFINLGYSYQFVSDYVKIHKNEHSIAKIYYSKKGNVRMAINPVCEQAFKSCFPVNYYSFVKAWTLGMKVFIAENDDLRTIHKFLSMVDKLHSEKYERRC